DEFGEEESDERYWYTATRMGQIGAVHDYLDALPETGKVLSLHTVVKVALQLTNGEKLDSLGLALLFKQLPEDFRDIISSPYVSIEDNQARVSIRMKDSLPTLRRAAFLQKLRRELPEHAGLAPEQIRLSGVMVLYNNMLQSLFRSQIQTAGVTVAALMVMFLVLFRSVSVSLIAIFPNVMASLVVLGVMGLLGIPLDMMTITIVAISIGIAVDNTIHYIHRFKHEFAADRNYLRAMHRAHGTIGNAMFYTSITIILGFSILGMSNFIPSVLFGLLTGLAMAMALLAALALLPKLILLVRPFGREDTPGQHSGESQLGGNAPV
ncbi:MAG: MMPL family transporter, partial [Lentisphaerae bacterium]|nr:MMPL family transporter [Lentisphaerota bacterium]